MERIEITVYPNQANHIEETLEEFKVPYIKMPAESYKVQCIFYVVTAPEEIASALLDSLAQEFDSNEKVNTIAHYKTESTVSEYLRKFEVHLREENNKDLGGKEKIANAPDKLLSDFRSVKDRIKKNKSRGGVLLKA